MQEAWYEAVKKENIKSFIQLIFTGEMIFPQSSKMHVQYIPYRWFCFEKLQDAIAIHVALNVT